MPCEAEYPLTHEHYDYNLPLLIEATFWHGLRFLAVVESVRAETSVQRGPKSPTATKKRTSGLVSLRLTNRQDACK